MQCYPMPYPPHSQGEGSSRGPDFDRLKQPVHDRLGQHQSAQGKNPRLVYPDRSNRSQKRPAQVRPTRQEYRIKEKKDEPEPMQVDSEKAPADDVVHIQDAQKGPMIIEKSVDASHKLVFSQTLPGTSFLKKTIILLYYYCKNNL